MLVNYKIRTKKQANLVDEIGSLFGELKQIQKNRFSYWYKGVGEKIGKIATPVYIKKGVLHVSVVNPVSRFELTRIKQEILENVNTHLNDNNKLKDIIFK